MKKSKKIILICITIIIILGVILSIFYIRNNKTNIDSNKKLEIAAKKYFSDNGYTNGNYEEVSVQTLIDENYIDESDVTEEQKSNGIVSMSSTIYDDEATLAVSYATASEDYTISGYSTKVVEDSYDSNTVFERYTEDGEDIFKIDVQNSVYSRSRFKLTISGVDPNSIYIFKAKIKTENVLNESNRYGGHLMQQYTKNGYSWSYSQENLKGTNNWTEASIVIKPEYQYETESEEDAIITAFLAIGAWYEAEWSYGTVYFKDLELINVENEEEASTLDEDEQVVIMESTNKKIKYVFDKQKRDAASITDEQLQKKIDLLETAYYGFGELVGNTDKTDELLFPYASKQLVIIETNPTYYSYGALANNPILVNYNSSAINLYSVKEDNSIGFGYLHEMGHTFDSILYSSDGTVKTKNAAYKWNWSSEKFANTKVFYLLDQKNIQVEGNDSTGQGYEEFLIENMKEHYSLGYDVNFTQKGQYSDNGFDYLMYTAITDEDGNVDWQALKDTFKWFNDTELSFSENSKKVLYFLAKLDEFSDIDVRSKLLDSDVDIIVDNFSITEMTDIEEIDNDIGLNSNKKVFNITPSDAKDVVFTSSNEDIAIIDEDGNVITNDKTGEVTFSAKGYFNQNVNYAITKNIINKIDISASDGVSNVFAFVEDGVLTITGTGKIRDFTATETKAWDKDTITKVIIEEGVTRIGKYTFYEHEEMTDIVLPDSLESIGNYAFYGCTSLKEITIPENVNDLEEYTFMKCTGLEEVTINGPITKIGNSAFNECTSLKKVVLPDTVTEIEDRAFYKCSALTTINMPANLTLIDFQAFLECSSLTEVVLPDTIKTIGTNVFWKCTSLKKLVVPESVESIGNNAFTYAVLNISVPFAGSTETSKEIEMPDILKQALDESSILYSSSGLSYTNCSLSGTDKINITYSKITTSTVSISVKSGELNYFTVKYTPNILSLGSIEIKTPATTTNYIEGENFNSDGMVVEAVYPNDEDNTEIRKEITDYTIVDGDNLQPGQNSVTISYTVDGVTKTTTQAVTITELLKINLEDYVETLESDIKYLENIEPNTKVENLKNSITTNGTIEVYNNNEILSDSDMLSTGDDIKISLNDEEVIYKIIVKGELNGDGQVDTGDILKLYRHVLGTNNITKIHYLKAAQINNDNTIDTGDVLKLYRFVNGSIENL